jgi:spore coat protein CotH
MGSFRPIDEKPSLTLKFNEFTSGQRFHGLTKITLNNSVQDPTYTTEALCTALFRDAGVPAARVAHAQVWLNDRYLGLYVLLEGLSKDFLKLNFKNCDGALYEPYVQDIDEELKQDNGEDTTRADLKALLQAAQEVDASARWPRIQKVLDIDRFISMMAGEALMAHWDGYWVNHNNYRIYHDTTHDRMVLIPHGLDSMFQQPTMSWQPKEQTLLVQAVLQTSEGQRRYRERLMTLHGGLFKTESLQNRVNEIAARLRPILAADNPDALRDWEKEVAKLSAHIAERMKFLTEELALTAPATQGSSR